MTRTRKVYRGDKLPTDRATWNSMLQKSPTGLIVNESSVANANPATMLVVNESNQSIDPFQWVKIGEPTFEGSSSVDLMKANQPQAKLVAHGVNADEPLEFDPDVFIGCTLSHLPKQGGTGLVTVVGIATCEIERSTGAENSRFLTPVGSDAMSMRMMTTNEATQFRLMGSHPAETGATRLSFVMVSPWIPNHMVLCQAPSGGIPAADNYEPGFEVCKVLVFDPVASLYKDSGRTKTVYTMADEAEATQGLRLLWADFDGIKYQLHSVLCKDERTFVEALVHPSSTTNTGGL